MPSLHAGKIAHFIRGLLLPAKYGITFDQQTFPMKHLSFQKRLNYGIQGIRRVINPWNGFGMPPVLQIEPVNYCNLHCRTCAFGAGLIHRPPTAMSFDLYRSVIDQVKRQVSLVAFWAWGEPFLHEKACDMIRYAKDSGLLVHTSTNGHFFQTEEKARRVIESGLDSIIICLDGLDEKTYGTYRVGGKLGTVIQSTENLVRERKRLGKSNPRITLRFIVMKHNVHQVRAFEKLAPELGVDALSLRLPIVRRDTVNLEKIISPFQGAFGKEPSVGKMIPFRKAGRSPGSCSRPYGNLTIFSNGEVVLCENDHNASCPLGNVSGNPIREILSSDKARGRLALFRHHPDGIPFCRNCRNDNLKGDRLNIRSRSTGKASPQ